MKTTLTYISIISITFILCFVESAALSIVWINAHWVRELLVLIFIAITLFLGLFMFFTKASQQKGNKVT